MKLLKGKKTKLIKALVAAQKVEYYQNNEHDIELNLWLDGDVSDIIRADWFNGDYICIETLDKQVTKLSKKYDKIELRLPHQIYEFYEIELYEKQ